MCPVSKLWNMLMPNKDASVRIQEVVSAPASFLLSVLFLFMCSCVSTGLFCWVVSLPCGQALVPLWPGQWKPPQPNQLRPQETCRNCPSVTSVGMGLSGQWWRHETNTVTLVALCAPTVTSTSNRRAISLWRGSCTVRLTLVLEWDHQRDTTWSRLSLLHRFTTNTQTHIQTDPPTAYICLCDNLHLFIWCCLCAVIFQLHYTFLSECNSMMSSLCRNFLQVIFEQPGCLKSSAVTTKHTCQIHHVSFLINKDLCS